jgi:hypothetical protein
MSNNHYFPLKRVYSHSLPENSSPLPVIKFYCRLAAAKAKMASLEKANEDFEVVAAAKAVDISSDVIETDFKIAIDSFARASADAVAALAVSTRAKYDADDAAIAFANAKDDVDAVERLSKVKYDEILNVTDDSFAKAAAFAASVAISNSKKAAIAATDATIAAYKAEVDAADAFAVKADIDATAAEEKLSVTNKKLYIASKIKADVARTKAYSCAASVTASNAKVNIAISEAAVASSAATLESLLTSVNANEAKAQLDVANAKVVVAESKNDTAIIQSVAAKNAAEKAKAVCEEAISKSVSVALLSAKADSVAADANALRNAEIVKKKADSNSNDYSVKAEIAKAKADAYAKAASEMKTKADDYADVARSYSAYFSNHFLGYNSKLLASGRDNSNAIFVYEPAMDAATTKSEAFAAVASITKAKANAYATAALKSKAVSDTKTAIAADAAIAKADYLVKLKNVPTNANADADSYADALSSADDTAYKTTLNAYNAYRNSNYYNVKNKSTSMILDLAKTYVTNAKEPIDGFEAAKLLMESTTTDVVKFFAAAANAYAAVEKAKTKADVALAVATKTKSVVATSKAKEDAYNALVEADAAASKVKIYTNVAITKEVMDAAETDAVYNEKILFENKIYYNSTEEIGDRDAVKLIKILKFKAEASRTAANSAKEAYNAAVEAANAVENQTNNSTNEMVNFSVKRAREVTFDISPHYTQSYPNDSSYVKQETSEINMMPAYRGKEGHTPIYEIARNRQRELDMSESNIALVKAKASAYSGWAADAAKAKAAAFAKKNNSAADLATYYAEAERKRRLDAEASSTSRYSYQLINPRLEIPHRREEPKIPIDEERQAEKAAEEAAAKKVADDEARKKIQVNTAETVKAKADTYRAAAKVAKAKADAFAAAADAAKAKADAFANINIKDVSLRVKAAADAAERAVSRAKMALNSATTAATKTKKESELVRDFFVKSKKYLAKNSNSEYLAATNATAAAKKYALEMSKASTRANTVAAEAKSDLANAKSQGDTEAYKKAKEHSLAMSKASAEASAAAHKARTDYIAKLKMEKAAAKNAKADAAKDKAKIDEFRTGTVIFISNLAGVSQICALIKDDSGGNHIFLRLFQIRHSKPHYYYSNHLNQTLNEDKNILLFKLKNGDRVRYNVEYDNNDSRCDQKGNLVAGRLQFGRRLKLPPIAMNVEIIEKFSFF